MKNIICINAIEYPSDCDCVESIANNKNSLFFYLKLPFFDYGEGYVQFLTGTTVLKTVNIIPEEENLIEVSEGYYQFGTLTIRLVYPFDSKTRTYNYYVEFPTIRKGDMIINRMTDTDFKAVFERESVDKVGDLSLLTTSDKSNIVNSVNEVNKKVDTKASKAIVSTTAAGLCPKTDGDSKKYLSGSGSWQVPPNTWRPVENILTSTSTTNGLSAAMGKYLNENKMNTMQAVSRTYMDGKDVPTGFYRVHNTATGVAQVWISLNYDTNFSVQMQFDYGDNTLYMRQCLYGTWTEWKGL